MYFDCNIVLELYDCGIWHRGCRIESIVFGLCRLYLDSTIVFGLYNCMIWLYLDCVDCTIVFGLYVCIWIVQLRDLAQGA